MVTAFSRKGNNWFGYLLLSVIITAVCTVISCFLLMNYNLLMDNQLTVIDKIILALVGALASVIAAAINIRAMRFLFNSTEIKKKYLKLILINLPLFFYQAFVFLASLMILLYD